MNVQLQYFVNNEQLFRTRASEVEKITPEIINHLDEMLKIVYKYKGIGLGANQAGLLERLVVVDLQKNDRKSPIFMINPEIIFKSEETEKNHEGSLSFPVNVKDDFEIERHKKITVKFLNKQGKEQILNAEGLLAVCIQHEVDYLDGKLFIDYLSEEDRNSVLIATKNKIELMSKKQSGLCIKYITKDDNVLRKKCENVSEVNDEIRQILHAMLDYMYERHGIGLAGNQIGVSKKLVVIDLQEEEQKNPMFFINPEIIEKSTEMIVYNEGCLSIPEQKAEVKRHKEITVKYLNIDGEEKILKADDLLSVCLQHEIDHLNGILYIDHLSKIKKMFIINKVKKTLNGEAI